MIARVLGNVRTVRPTETQIAHIWVKVSTYPTGTLIEDAHNVTSVTRNGTGDWTFTWEQPFSATAYALAGIAQGVVPGGEFNAKMGIRQSTELTTTSARLVTGNSAGTAADVAMIMLVGVGPS